jgi:hypothetical protein
LKNGNIFDDFFQILGIHEDVSYQVPGKENESLSSLGVQLLASLNQTQKNKNLTTRSVRKAIIANNGVKRYSIPEDLHDKYKEEFNASNEWVRAHFFPDKERLFLSKYIEKPAESGIDDCDIECICKILVSLAESKEKEIRALEQSLEKLRGHITFKGFGIISGFKRKVVGLFNR